MAKYNVTRLPSKRSVQTIEVAGSIPCDIDTAGIALSQAAAILDMLTVAVDGVEIPDTYPRTLVQTIYAAHSEVARAKEALFGKEVHS